MSYVALLRGINLGKINKVDMQSLRSLFAQMGFPNVRTHIQTGNVLFDEIVCDEQQLEARLKQTYGFDIPVTYRSKEELENVANHPLFPQDRVYVVFLKNPLSAGQRERLNAVVNDEFAVVDPKTVIIRLSQNFHQTKYNNAFFENQLNMLSTLRNRNTVEQILRKMR